ncbi:MAG: uroporphyrinogen-III decarboxylase-like protein, partial [Armatimonadetes bacterium]|nr:uroporphyrinogen-III decarboxylase-like protein [Armatimonadota bacterium]
MTKRDIIRRIFDGERAPYVPWHFRFTIPAREKLQRHFGGADLEDALDNHLVMLGDEIGFFEDIGNDRVRDAFGVIWDRTIDKDIGNVEGCVLPEPTLAGTTFPDPVAPRFFENIGPLTAQYPDRFRVYAVGFSLYERA